MNTITLDEAQQTLEAYVTEKAFIEENYAGFFDGQEFITNEDHLRSFWADCKTLVLMNELKQSPIF